MNTGYSLIPSKCLYQERQEKCGRGNESSGVMRKGKEEDLIIETEMKKRMISLSVCLLCLWCQNNGFFLPSLLPSFFFLTGLNYDHGKMMKSSQSEMNFCDNRQNNTQFRGKSCCC